MIGPIRKQIERLEALVDVDAGPWCPECGHGQQIIVLRGDEPEPICETCGRPKARGEGIRIIQISRVPSGSEREGDPA